MEENFTVPITRPQSFQAPPPSQKQEATFPTEVIELPSKGFFYKENDPLSSGKVELKMMTAKEEDILTSENLIKKGVVLDKLLESLIVDKSIKIENILIGDKNALYVAARRLAYGDSYGPVGIVCKNCKEESKIDINLAELKDKEYDFSKYSKSEKKELFQPIKGLEKNKRIPATAVINGFKTKCDLRPGVSIDLIRLPIYQGDYNAPGTSILFSDYICDIVI